ncbi:aminoglycoside phosphotransferase family protein [Nocardia gipuzkoensis]|uniref:phosphotransferase enzyme family protein n=1 Tax=Nocardia TaxID=1817 RepID=UPI001E28FB0E|nr:MULTISPECIES: aminoglycoside phosphotransferase family protein [Nocardia]UGT70846.1 aminoglycoside phosphotransferase family protein [Nocardia gipuzkoensis]
MTSATELLQLCRRHLDPNSRPVEKHRGHENTTVLRATTTHGEVIVKAHRGRDRHSNELYAYEHWTPTIVDRAPRLLAHIQDPPAIIITAIPGRPLAELTTPTASEHAAYQQAGALLAAWHNAQPATDEIEITAQLADRGERWLHLAGSLLSAAERSTIRAHLRALAALTGIPAVPCHLDFTPRNLLYTPGGSVHLIDFEHSRLDLAARDLVRLADRYWRQRPDLEAAFLTTYGPLTELDHQVIEHCIHLDRLTTAVRATGRSLPPTDPRQPNTRRTP